MADWSEFDEADLLRQAQAGKAEAFGQIYEYHAPAVFRFLFAHLDNRLDAEDLTGEVFLRAWQALPGFEQQGLPFVAFLFRIARNGLTDHYRRSGRRQPLLSLAEDEDEGIQLADPGADPADIVLVGLEQVALRRTLAALRTDYRLVLELRFLGDLSPDEVAQVMERSSGAVRILQHRALLALRQLLEKEASAAAEQPLLSLDSGD